MKHKKLILTLLLTLFLVAVSSSLMADSGSHAHQREFIKKLLSKDVNPFIAIVAMLVPITAIAGTVVFGTLFVKWWHQRRMLMIEKGMVEQSLDKYRLNSLLWGIIALAIGAGVLIQKLIVNRPPKGGVVLLLIGAGLLIFRKIISGKDYK